MNSKAAWYNYAICFFFVFVVFTLFVSMIWHLSVTNRLSSFKCKSSSRWPKMKMAEEQIKVSRDHGEIFCCTRICYNRTLPNYGDNN